MTNAQSKADGKGKPSACSDVKKDDYDALVLSSVIDALGWTDKDGNFDDKQDARRRHAVAVSWKRQGPDFRSGLFSCRRMIPVRCCRFGKMC
ncbi:hypothetical protein ACFWAN_00500 [Streptomyces mirabilis]|uniref:hypothetical protein n=1 Tax=Streptomyces TaxID=1883 RepID=UPI0011641EEE|nr:MULTISPECIES: hypothetical protein [Streptomyces]MCX4615913.1 hypothetical protein [Streptomyces mirabilis]MCX5347312.1 hypothetical protein [Streptomyces mirabilis]QDN86020.1 hypothetical protein FNV61_10770 [Streptomyces sp. RLB3-6]QDO06831.1 hypothetical protein FNV68_11870 [Streptomyces sp. S1D4-23]